MEYFRFVGEKQKNFQKSWKFSAILGESFLKNIGNFPISMGKKCTICSQEAMFWVKGSSEYYCQGCAEEHFGDVSLLVPVDEQAKNLKKAMEEVPEEDEDEERREEE